MVEIQRILEKKTHPQQDKLPGLSEAQSMLKGKYHKLTPRQLHSKTSKLFYSHPHGEIWHGDAISWLKKLPDESVDLIFADPPYNIKKAEWDTFDSQQAYLKWSLKWIKEAARILKPHGTLYICGFSEILADLKLPALRFFTGCRWLVWHYKNKANLGSDWGRSHESILHFRKSKDFLFNIDDIRISYGDHTLKYPDHPQAQTSQYGNKDGKDHIWKPNPHGAKPKDVWWSQKSRQKRTKFKIKLSNIRKVLVFSFLDASSARKMP